MNQIEKTDTQADLVSLIMQALILRYGETDRSAAEYLCSLFALTHRQSESEEVHRIANEVRTALDRRACPDAYMVIAYEAVVNALNNAGHAKGGE